MLVGNLELIGRKLIRDGRMDLRGACLKGLCLKNPLDHVASKIVRRVFEERGGVDVWGRKDKSPSVTEIAIEGIVRKEVYAEVREVLVMVGAGVIDIMAEDDAKVSAIVDTIRPWVGGLISRLRADVASLSTGIRGRVGDIVKPWKLELVEDESVAVAPGENVGCFGVESKT